MNGSFTDAIPVVLGGGLLVVWGLVHVATYYYLRRCSSSGEQDGGKLLAEPIRLPISKPSLYSPLVIWSSLLTLLWWMDFDPAWALLMGCFAGLSLFRPFMFWKLSNDFGWLELREHGIACWGRLEPWSEIKRYCWGEAPSLRLVVQYRTTRCEFPVPSADREAIDAILSAHVEQEPPVPESIRQGHA